MGLNQIHVIKNKSNTNSKLTTSFLFHCILTRTCAVVGNTVKSCPSLPFGTSGWQLKICRDGSRDTLKIRIFLPRKPIVTLFTHISLGVVHTCQRTTDLLWELVAEHRLHPLNLLFPPRLCLSALYLPSQPQLHPWGRIF